MFRELPRDLWPGTQQDVTRWAPESLHAVVRSLIGALSSSLYEDSIFLSYPYIFEEASPVVKFDMTFQKVFRVSCPSSCCLLYPDIPTLSPLNPSILVHPFLNNTILFALPWRIPSSPWPHNSYPTSVTVWIETFI